MRRRATSTDPGLPDAVRAILLHGWGTDALRDVADPWAAFDLDDAAYRAAWRQHRAALMREARRRGISEPWGRQFDNERGE